MKPTETADRPLVSVVIPCYNQAHFLREAIESALAQTYTPLEIVVVDDGSTDDTFAVAQSYGDRVVAVRQPNAGLSAARNAAIRASNGAFVVLLDSDDKLLPSGVASRVRFLLEDPEVAIVTGYYREMDAEGTLLPRIPELRKPTAQPALYQTVRRNWGPPVGWTIRRSALERCGLFDPLLRSCEDWDLLIRLSSRYGFAYDPEVGAHYRQLPGQMSRNSLVMYDAGLTVLRKNAAYAKNKWTYGLWARFGQFQHGRRILYNVLTTGRPGDRLRELVRVTLRRPGLLWIGALSAFSFLTGKRPSA